MYISLYLDYSYFISKEKILNYNFEWDPNKADKNFKKHKIRFENAAEIFLDPFALSIFDDEHSIDEDRYITIGLVKNDNLIVVVHTFVEFERDQIRIRIISARKASKKEIKQYQDIKS